MKIMRTRQELFHENERVEIELTQEEIEAIGREWELSRLRQTAKCQLSHCADSIHGLRSLLETVNKNQFIADVLCRFLAGRSIDQADAETWRQAVLDMFREYREEKRQ